MLFLVVSSSINQALAENYDYIQLANSFSKLTELQQKESVTSLLGHTVSGSGEILNIGECSFVSQSKEYKRSCIEIELFDNDSHKLIAYAPESMQSSLTSYNKGQKISIKNCIISNIKYYGFWTSVYCDIIPQQSSGNQEAPAHEYRPDTAQETKEVPTNKGFNHIFANTKYWTSDWGNDITAAISKTPCKDPKLLSEGYEFRAYSSLPVTRIAKPSEAWYTFDDRAVTVVGCWLNIGEGLIHYKMKRKKDNRLFEQDVNLMDGSWEATQ